MLESLELEEEELESGTETERDEGWRGLEKGRRSALLLLMMLKGREFCKEEVASESRNMRSDS